MKMVTVISLGGSIIVPDSVDVAFLGRFNEAVRTYLAQDEKRKLILVCGGGAPARVYQQAMKSLDEDTPSEALDWLGIKATHLNAQLVKTLFADLAPNEVVTDPTAPFVFEGRILVAAGWKPGFSTDTDAVYLAERFDSKLIINLSNTAQVYTADPKKDPDAKPLVNVSWKEYRKMIGNEWTPGRSTPFDPIASARAQELGMSVVCADGRRIDNTIAILEGREFFGTTIA
jgi:uridylate kinase